MVNFLAITVLFFSSCVAATMSASAKWATWPSAAETLDQIPGYFTYLAQQLAAQEATTSSRRSDIPTKKLPLAAEIHNYDCRIINNMTLYTGHVIDPRFNWQIQQIDGHAPDGYRACVGIEILLDHELCSLNQLYSAFKCIVSSIQSDWVQVNPAEYPDILQTPDDLDTHLLFIKENDGFMSHESKYNEDVTIRLLLSKFLLDDHAICDVNWIPNTDPKTGTVNKHPRENKTLYLWICKERFEEFQVIFNFNLTMIPASSAGAGVGCPTEVVVVA